MKPTSLYNKYFQKSKIFLYPLLDIKRGSSVTPIQTYLGWNEHYTSEDMKLIVTYHRREDEEFLQFEKEVLLKHTRLADYVHLDDDTILLSFDFSDIEEDWNLLLAGKYSCMNKKTKFKIRNFFEKDSGNYMYVDSYLFPERYFEVYSELLNVTVESLKKVGELCALSNLEKEMLIATVENLENRKILD